MEKWFIRILERSEENTKANAGPQKTLSTQEALHIYDKVCKFITIEFILISVDCK